MEEQLIYTTFNPRIIELLTGIKSIVGEFRGQPEKLKAALEERIQDIDYIKAAIFEDLTINDNLLENLGLTLTRRYINGGKRLEYRVITECTNPECSEPLKIVQGIPADRYIHEIDFSEAWDIGDLPVGLDGQDVVYACPRCNKQFEVTGSSNLVFPRDEEALSAIALSVKSPGRYCEKLVDLIFYDKNDPLMVKRSITDRFRFKMVMAYPNGMNAKQYARVFRNQMGFKLPSNLHEAGAFRGMINDALGVDVPQTYDLGDFACFGMLLKMARDFKPGPEDVQNTIAKPKRRPSPHGRIDLFKMLQFNLPFYDKRYEAQIKTVETWRREQDRHSGFYHETYKQFERKLRKAMFKEMPEAYEVYLVLRKIFG